MPTLRTSAFALLMLACASPPPFVPTTDAPPPDGSRRSTFGAGSGSTPGGTDPGACRARVLVVFDRSGSMDSPWGDAPRYRVAADAVEAVVMPLERQLDVGAIFFPARDGSSCSAIPPVDAQIPYQDGASFLGVWRDVWARPDVGGGTPIDEAMEAAEASIPDDDVATAVVLLTDGEPSCDGPTPAATVAARLSARGVRTWVIGLPGVSGSAYLDAIAVAGDTPATLEPARDAELRAGLEAALGQALDQACAD